MSLTKWLGLAPKNDHAFKKNNSNPLIACDPIFQSHCHLPHNGHSMGGSTSTIVWWKRRQGCLNVQKWSEHVALLPFWLRNLLGATAACTCSTSYFQKANAFDIFTSKCASRHNGVHFLNISTSKSAPTLKCLAHFDFQMGFAPQSQSRALFRHLIVQTCSETAEFLSFSLRSVPRATMACNFWSLIRPDASEPATLARLLSDLPVPQCFATFLPFRTLWSACFFLSLCWSSFFSLFLFSDFSHLCFSICHIVGSLTAKLPPVRLYIL